jgi:hypothetical protein
MKRFFKIVMDKNQLEITLLIIFHLHPLPIRIDDITILGR